MRNFIVYSVIAVILFLLLYVGFLYFQPDDSLTPGAVAWLEEERPTIPVEQNSHYFIWGLNAPADTSMRDYGEAVVKHIIASQQATKTKTATDELPGSVPDGFDEAQLLEAEGTSALCVLSERYCLDEYSSGVDTILAQGHNRLLLERYSTLNRLEHYQSVEPLYAMTPFPQYSSLRNAQRLYLAELGRRYLSGERQEVMGQLAQDLHFSRMLMLEGDTLIVRMIGLVMTSKSLQLYGQLLDLPSPEAAIAEVEAITVLTQVERDFQHVLVGEFRFMANTVSEMEEHADLAESAGFIFSRVLPLRKNSLFNFEYEYLAAAVELSRLPAEEFALRAVNFEEGHTWTPDAWDYAFDPLTSILKEIARPSMVYYMRRTYEFNGLIRLLKLKSAILQDDVPEGSIAAFIPKSRYAFADAAGQVPVQWDAEQRRLYFAPAEGGDLGSLNKLPFK